MKKILLLITAFLLLTNTAFAQKLLFVKEDCQFCQSLRQELNSKDYYQLHDIVEYDITTSKENQDLFLQKSKELGYKAGAVPLLIDGLAYLEGKQNIISHLQNTEPNYSSSITPVDSEELNEIIQDQLENPPEDSKRPFPKTATTIIAAIIILATIKILWRND